MARKSAKQSASARAGRGKKKAITAKQKSARRKNIAVARSKKKKGGATKAPTRKQMFEKKRREFERKLKAVRRKHGSNLPSHIETDLMRYF